MKIKLFLTFLITPLLLGCTAQERSELQTLENLSGITCTDDQGHVSCGPDSLSATDQD